MRTKYALGLSVLTIAGVCHADWQYPHGDSANTGFANTVTAPAGSAIRVNQVGELAAGAGPVVASDGTVYVGNLSGSVLAFRADGTLLWSRQLPAGQWITSSPVIGGDGSVYVVAEDAFPVAGSNRDFRYESTLHKFSPAGDWLFQAPFPQRWANTTYSSRGDANATPNIWRSNGVEAIIVPAVYGIPQPSYNSLRLIAFSTEGQVLGDSLVKQTPDGTSTYGGSGCDWYNIFCWIAALDPAGFLGPPTPRCTDYSVCLPDETGFTQLGTAIWEFGVTPTVVVSDGLKDVVAYTFDPAHGFRATFGVTDARNVRTSTPMILPDGHTVIAVTMLDTGAASPTVLRFEPPNFAGLSPIGGLGPITAAATRLPDYRFVAIERSGRLQLFGNNMTTRTIDLPGESVAPASASSNYLYVSSAGAFTTFDVHTLAQVGSFRWYGGGRSSAAIGPFGHVYAVAGTVMYVWPPPQSTVVNFVQLHASMGGIGSIVSTPAGIDCSYRSNRCTAAYAMNSQLILNAAGLVDPNNHDEYDFDHWEGSCAGSSSSCSVTMDQERTVRAVFVKVGNSGP